MRIEEPAYGWDGGSKTATRHIWTDVEGRDGQSVPGHDAKFDYLPGVLVHEFGHAVGMTDLPKGDAGKQYKDFLMQHSRANLDVLVQDIFYLQQVYDNEQGDKPH